MNYRVIQVHTSEEIRWRGKPLSEAILAFVRDLKLAARCTVVRGLPAVMKTAIWPSFRTERGST